MLLRDGLQVNSLDLILLYAGGVLAPAAAAWVLAAWHTVRVEIADSALRLAGRHEQIEIPLARITALRVWQWPLPWTGVDLHLASGRRFEAGLATSDPAAFLRALVAAGAPARFDDATSVARAHWAAARHAARWPRLDDPLVRFVVFPLLPALPAFHLHQQIAFGGAFGEWQTYGAGAWLVALAIWWAAWSIGVMLFAAALRVAVEALVATLAAAGRPQDGARRVLEGGVRALVYLGVPAALALRLLTG
jgi:apolipoprotein N-acyltransferase